MIQVISITIENFRGIKRLKLDLGGKNFAICGPNGTGKSGIVDAIEFALTGSVTRLTGQGTSGISIKEHAPHVDGRKQPRRSRVILEASIPSLKKSITIERNVYTPSAPAIRPDDDTTRAVLEELERHPEFALSRREILRYVLTPPGERSKEVQTLLRLDQIEKVRQSLLKIANSCTAELRTAEAGVTAAKTQLLAVIGGAELRPEALLNTVNARRSVLRLVPLTEIKRDTSLKAGMIDIKKDPEARPTVSKARAIADLTALDGFLQAEDPAVTIGRKEVAVKLTSLSQKPELLRSLRQQEFLKSGLDLLDEALCPFCDTAWDLGELREVIARKLSAAKEANDVRQAVLAVAAPVIDFLTKISALIKNLAAFGEPVVLKPEIAILNRWTSSLESATSGIRTLSNPVATRQMLIESWNRGPDGTDRVMEDIRARVNALPDLSKEDEAREFLTVCQERLERYRSARRTQELWKGRAEIAQKVLSHYSESTTAVLTGVYKSVEQDFSRYYRFINREDEDAFEGKLTPSLGKLGFDVDFYGRGFFPPGAYHSEGHQDGMGLCLYLALMKHTLGEGFTFAVLDDVLMSVDAGHRREVCGLLKLEFPNTQFIFTTHDPIWLHHMMTEQVIKGKSSIRFRKWTIDDGPMLWTETEVWEEIAHDLDSDDVSGAAGTLRRFLEFISAQLADKLRANVEFHADAQYDLGDLLPRVAAIWRELLNRAEGVAKAWGKQDEVTAIKQRQDDFTAKLARSQVEQWAINKSIHYNEWGTFKKQDFTPVVAAFKELLASFQCPTCGGYFYVTPQKGSRESVRCDCSAVTLNLKEPS